MKTMPFWTDAFPRPVDISVSELPSSVDVVVVGSGYTGLNAAIKMVKAGLKVAVLEQETIGWGASSRNGTFCSPSLKAEWKTIKKRYGAERASYFWDWTQESVMYVSDMIAQESIDCDFRRTGLLGLAVKPTHAKDFEAYVEQIRKYFGYEGYRFIPKEDLYQEIGTTIYYGGLASENCYQLHPAKYVFGLARAAAKHGAILVEKAGVERIYKNGASYRLRTSLGDLRSEKVLLATGGYTTNLLPRARNGILPVGSYMITTEPLPPEVQTEICPTGRLFYDSKIYLNYFGLTPDGRAFIGGRANLSPNLDWAKAGKGLRARLLEIYPQLAEYKITHAWSGKLGVSFDQMPHIGRVDGIYFAYGYSGQGVSTGSYMGAEVGELIAGIRQTSAFKEIKHPRSFLAPLDWLYLPFVSYWFKILDRIG